jgi:hypothetical protein
MMVSVLLVLLVVGVPALAVLLDRLLKFYWKDARTRMHRRARAWLIALSALAVITGCFVTIVDRVRADERSRRLVQALKEAEIERKAQALAGRFENPEGLGRVYQIGDSGTTFVDSGEGSILNSVVSKTVAGRLLVTAKVHGRDGLLAEIEDNEWRVSPPPKSWDRNYSTNALEVKDADGNIVFQIKLRSSVGSWSGRSVVSFQGIFFDTGGNGIAIMGDDPSRGAYMMRLFPNSTRQLPRIKPLFKYPSSLHLGESAD